jgi:hypothetical protein
MAGDNIVELLIIALRINMLSAYRANSVSLDGIL